MSAVPDWRKLVKSTLPWAPGTFADLGPPLFFWVRITSFLVEQARPFPFWTLKKQPARRLRNVCRASSTGVPIMTTLAKKTALVTGGSRGIGAAIAKRLAAEGANVAITYTKGADAAASVVKEIEAAGGKAIAIQADATDAKAVKIAVEKTVTAYGRLDALVNNAGTAIAKPFEESTLEETWTASSTSICAAYSLRRRRH